MVRGSGPLAADQKERPPPTNVGRGLQFHLWHPRPDTRLLGPGPVEAQLPGVEWNALIIMGLRFGPRPGSGLVSLTPDANFPARRCEPPEAVCDGHKVLGLVRPASTPAVLTVDIHEAEYT